MSKLTKLRNLAILAFWLLFTGLFAEQIKWLNQNLPSDILPQNSQVLGSQASAQANQVNLENDQSFTTTKIVDGDTIHAVVNGQDESIRLIGIDAPEISHGNSDAECYGYNAKAHLQSLIDEKIIKMESDPNDSDRDRYGRLLRYIYLEDGTNINNQMILEGYAKAYPYHKGNKYEQLFEASEETAHFNKLGMWGSTCNQ